MTPDCILKKIKLGASPRLELWNAGILEKWVLGYWSIGLMVRRRRNEHKVLNGLYPLKTHYSIISLFHYSMGEAKTQALKNTLFFILFTINSDYSGQDL